MRPYNLNGGRPSKLTDEQRQYIRSNLKKPLRTLASELGVSHSTIYNNLKTPHHANRIRLQQ